MKSILKQVLTVVVLLSVPAVFAAEATRWEKAKASVKAGASKTRAAVVNAAKAGYNKTAVKAGELYAWTINPNDTKLKRAGKIGLVATAATVAGAAVYFTYKKLASMYSNYKAKAKTAKLEAGKNAPAAQTPVVAPVAKTAEQIQTERVMALSMKSAAVLDAFNATKQDKLRV